MREIPDAPVSGVTMLTFEATDGAEVDVSEDSPGQATVVIGTQMGAVMLAHEGDADAHPGYATDADLTTHAATPHGGGGVTDHGALTGLADGDHPQYATDTSLNLHASNVNAHHDKVHDVSDSAHHSGTLTDAQIPATIARDTEVAAAVTAHEGATNPHATYATDADLTAHGAAADPHPGYLTPAEGNAAYSATGHAHTLVDGDIPATIARDSEVTAAVAAHAGTSPASPRTVP